eukprot:scaffold10379_cov18-Tisochrysis_lutea.AAC.3
MQRDRLPWNGGLKTRMTTRWRQSAPGCPLRTKCPLCTNQSHQPLRLFATRRVSKTAFHIEKRELKLHNPNLDVTSPPLRQRSTQLHQ